MRRVGRCLTGLRLPRRVVGRGAYYRAVASFDGKGDAVRRFCSAEEKPQQTQEQREQSQQKKAHTVERLQQSQKGGSGRGPVSWLAVGLLAVCGGAFVYWYTSERERLRQQIQSKSIGKIAIGGPFTLVSHGGLPVTDADFRGKWLLVYFGFTFCPDVCPAELIKMGKVLDVLDVHPDVGADRLVPLMITVDARRDTVGQLRQYCREFHPRLLGLTGTPQQSEQVAKAYRVYSSTGLTDDELDEMDDYLVDHTIFFYLMGPDGQIRQYFGQQMTSAQITEQILSLVREEDAAANPSLWKRWFG